MKVRGFTLVAALLLAPGSPAVAAEGSKLIEKAEMSMQVKGNIDMRPDGSVASYSIDHPEKLSQAVTQLVGTQVSQWRFEPVLVDGKPVAARTNMWLRIVAKPIDDKNFNVHIQSASFSGASGDGDNRVSVRKKTSLAPMVSALMSTGLGAANLYLALKIGPDGKVQDAIVEQVELPVLGTEREMVVARSELGKSALEVVRKWTFNVPTKGEQAGQPYWSGVLPISFTMSDGSTPPADVDEYGQWKAYVPGPCTSIPWRVLEKGRGSDRCGSDAAPQGEFTLDNAGPILLTPLMQGG